MEYEGYVRDRCDIAYIYPIGFFSLITADANSDAIPHAF